ncbi:ABC transporter ATP-binding protein [Riemerella anatipestifer]|nr:ABC transporter ATP-binding protein [Riemerella anatipestifer]
MELITDAIYVKNLEFSYRDREVISKANVSFKKNQLSILLGANGSGKSTLFNILSGLISKYNGEIEFLGKDFNCISRKEKAEMIGVLPQKFESTFPLIVNDILLTGRAAFSRFNYTQNDEKRVLEVAEQLKISELLHKSFNTLSGGQQQMVLIGRILVQNPKIILLDEPTNHLDIYYQQHLLAFLKKLTQEGYTVIAIMHDPALAFQYADEVFYMHCGRVIKNTDTKPDLEMLKLIFGVDFLYIKEENNGHLVVNKNL